MKKLKKIPWGEVISVIGKTVIERRSGQAMIVEQYNPSKLSHKSGTKFYSIYALVNKKGEYCIVDCYLYHAAMEILHSLSKYYCVPFVNQIVDIDEKEGGAND